MDRPKTPKSLKPFNQRLKEVIIQNLGNENFGIDQLSSDLGISRSHLYLKIKQNFNISVSEYIRDIRLDEAMKLLVESDLTAAEISYNVGFSSPSYFNRCFHEKFGYPPGVIRQLKSSNNNQNPLAKTRFKKSKSSEESDFISQFINVKQSKNRYQGKSMVFVVVSGLILGSFLLWGKYFEKNITSEEISIGVLPIKYLSPLNDKEYWAEGITQSLINRLSIIEYLTIIPKATTERYSKSNLSLKEIGKELRATHLVTGSLQLEPNNKARLFLYLIDAKREKILLTADFNDQIENILDFEIDAAQKMMNLINVEISKRNQELIQEKPSKSFTAYDLYNRAISERDIEIAQTYLNLALELDSAFALAYARSASLYIEKYAGRYENYFKENYLDSANQLADLSLKYNRNLAEGHFIKGIYYVEIGKKEKALEHYQKAIKSNPNHILSLLRLQGFYMGEHEYVKVLELQEKIEKLDYNRFKMMNLRSRQFIFRNVGLKEYAKLIIDQIYKDSFDKFGVIDSVEYKMEILTIIHYYNYNNELLDLYLKAYKKDSITNGDLLHFIGYQYMFRGDYDTAYYYLIKEKRRKENLGQFELWRTHRLGFLAWKLDKHYEAEEYFKAQLFHCNESIKLNRPYSLPNAYFDLAGIYAFKGEKELAYENLAKFSSYDFFPIWIINLAKNDPLFDGIREERKFKDFIKTIEYKNKLKREEVQKWIENHELILN